MANFTVEIKAPELAEALKDLASAISGGSTIPVGKDAASLSDPDMVELPRGEDPRKYTMFQDLAKIAKRLQTADEEVYETVLHKFVPEGKKYSAIQAADWGTAIKAFKEALSTLDKKPSRKKAKEPEEDYEEEYEEVEEIEEPTYTVGEIRALAAKAKNAGVSVGPIMKKIAGVTKVSLIKESKYSAFAEALKEAMEEVE